jgi:uncharacterized membrane protein
VSGPRDDRRDGWAIGLALLLLVAGALHLAAPSLYDPIIPSFVPGSARAWTLATGVIEIALGCGLTRTSTRRAAATLTAIFFVVIFPANLQMAIDWSHRSAAEFAIALIRLPLQLPLIWWAWRVRDRSARPITL